MSDRVSNDVSSPRRLGSPAVAPVLIVGTHRSGTSVVANSLRHCGLFTGARLDKNGESTFFQRLNRRLTQEAGGHWTNPRAVYESLNAVEDLAGFAEPLRAYLTSLGAIEYWGLRAAFRGVPSGPWGWKDPRNGALLPLWLALFPDLKVVWVRRDPRASALSLVARSKGRRVDLEEQSRRFDVRTQWQRVGDTQRGRPLLADGWRSLRLASALELTVTSGELHGEVLAGLDVQLHTLDYEELINEPQRVLTAAGRFAGLIDHSSLYESAAADIAARDNAHDHPELERLSHTYESRLAALGYAP